MKHDDLCLALDLGGTKIEFAVVNSQGQILSLRKEFLKLEEGKDKVLNDICEWGLQCLRDFPSVKSVGISSCGPLDLLNGSLLDATNLLTNGKGWGLVPLRSLLQEKFQRPTFLDNDAACCALAEMWLGIGAKQKTENLMVLTLGTGLGTGIICNGQLFRSGRHRHPEAGHTIIDYKNKNDLCSCGVSGDSEGFLSGVHFTKRFNTEYKNSWTSKDIVEKARSGDTQALSAFEDYAEKMAVTLHNYCVIFCPEWIVFSGSFAEAFDLFAKRVHSRLTELLVRSQDIIPQLCVSELNNHSCLLGAASLCFNVIRDTPSIPSLVILNTN